MSIRPDPLLHVAPDGAQILTHRWQPDAPARGVVILAHGVGEHALRYEPLAQRLVREGYVVYANDHRGHGRLALEAGTLGDFGPAGFRGLASDLVQTLQLARAEHARQPVAMLGHSMGSFAVQLMLIEFDQRPDAAALSGTAALDQLVEAQMRGEGMAQPNARIANPRTRFDWLSRDPDVVDAYMADPLCAFSLTRASGGSLFECARVLAQPALLARIPKDLPLYLFSGDQDPVNGYLAYFDTLKARYASCGLQRLESRVYPQARHETLNELQRDVVMDDLVEWLDRSLARSA